MGIWRKKAVGQMGTEVNGDLGQIGSWVKLIFGRIKGHRALEVIFNGNSGTPYP